MNEGIHLDLDTWIVPGQMIQSLIRLMSLWCCCSLMPLAAPICRAIQNFKLPSRECSTSLVDDGTGRGGRAAAPGTLPAGSASWADDDDEPSTDDQDGYLVSGLSHEMEAQTAAHMGPMRRLSL